MPYPGQTTLTSMWPRILGAFPEHAQYWELFCGTCQMYKRKNPVPSVLVDKNTEVVAGAALQGSYIYLPVDVLEVLTGLVENQSFGGVDLAPDAFVYLDPPWRISKTGQGKPLYKFNLTDNDTARLLMLIRRLPVKTAILHYKDEMYDDILNDWNRLDMSVSFRGRVCDVALYCNYDFKAVRAHLPEMSGVNRTDRQRIKRKAQRWVDNFEALPMYEKQAIFELLKQKY